MGRAARWLRRIFGGKRSDPEAKARARAREEEEERRRWGLGKSFRESRVEVRRPRWAPPPPPARARGRAARGGNGDDEEEEEESKRAIAVAAATAAVAEAAVAAAQAAAAVVKLTSGGAGAFPGSSAAPAPAPAPAPSVGGSPRRLGFRPREEGAEGAERISEAPGFGERQHCQETSGGDAAVHARPGSSSGPARACRALRAQSVGPCTHPGHPTPEKRDHNVQTNMPKSDRFGSLKSLTTEATDQNTSPRSPGWNWLDRWMEDRYWNIHEPAAKSSLSTTMDDEKNAKILEVDPGKPQFSNNSKKSRGFAAAAAADSDSTTAQLSIPSPSTGEVMQPLSSLRLAAADLEEFGECPQFYSATSQQGRGGPFTPSKGCFGSYLDYPNYMANTESSKAKARSQSAPKQRPECYEKSGLMKRGQVSGSGSGCGYVSGQHDSAASGPQRSLHAKFANKAYPGSGRLDRLGMPIRY
uniref:DUF4005 domain-containing protein n=1 Tax=Ananas comosus var. bracteatus TaxID=296719 RepID=A0A6V7QNQ9_ANACO|nr:unnamed protein product [Ananas comosus var. bracteatus]